MNMSRVVKSGNPASVAMVTLIDAKTPQITVALKRFETL